MFKQYTRVVGTGLLSGLSGLALAAPTLELGENTTLDSSLTVNYTASMRTSTTSTTTMPHATSSAVR